VIYGVNNGTMRFDERGRREIRQKFGRAQGDVSRANVVLRPNKLARYHLNSHPDSGSMVTWRELLICPLIRPNVAA
jgi:hypothetical protein